MGKHLRLFLNYYFVCWMLVEGGICVNLYLIEINQKVLIVNLVLIINI